MPNDIPFPEDLKDAVLRQVHEHGCQFRLVWVDDEVRARIWREQPELGRRHRTSRVIAFRFTDDWLEDYVAASHRERAGAEAFIQKELAGFDWSTDHSISMPPEEVLVTVPFEVLIGR